MNDVRAQCEMPRYKCHKEVHALKIASVEPPNIRKDQESDGSKLLVFEGSQYAPLRISHEWWVKHNPQPGGYYVVYADGYTSWSPAKAFEDGYVRVDT